MHMADQSKTTEKRLKLSDDFDLVVTPLPLGRVKISLERFNDSKEWAMALDPEEAKWLKENL